MYEVGVNAQFEAAHRLIGDFGPATRMHGHTYRLEAVVRGKELDEHEVLIDIGRLRRIVDDLASSLNYRDLDQVDGLAGKNTTAEAVARYCWETLAVELHGYGMASLAVRVWESPQVWASREDNLAP